MKTYEESLKVYRDNKNTMDYAIETAKIEAKREGKLEGKIEGKLEVARELKKNGVSIDIIAKSTGLTKEQIKIL